MLQRLTLQQLHAFERVATLGGFRVAAEHLHVSPPALSRTIRITEELVGTRLFDRDTRHVRLTAAGTALLPIAQRILAEFHNANSDLAGFLSGTRGLIRLGVLPSAGTTLVPQVMAAFGQTHPAVRVTMTEAAAQPLEHQLLAGRIDFALTAQPAARDEFTFTALLQDQLVLLCASTHRFAQQAQVSWAEAAQETLIDFSERSSIRPLIDHGLASRQLQFAQRMDSGSIATCCAMVAEGLGVALVPQLALELCGHRARARLRVLQLGGAPVQRSVGILTLAQRSLSPACEQFIAHITAHLNNYANQSPAGDQSAPASNRSA